MKSKKPAPSTPRKQSYKTPTLTTYGRLKDLTSGGSGKNIESKPGGPKHHAKA